MATLSENGWRLGRPALLVVTVVLAGCTVLPTSALPAGSPPARSSRIVVAQGHGWSAAGLDGPVPPPGSCHLRTAADGEPLPDPSCTPGAVDPAVRDTNTATTVCRKGGYTSSVRPPEALTEPAKRALLAAYGIPAKQISHYELDHLVDLASGGASDIRNLWPEPDTVRQFKPSSYVHNDKDTVESYTFHALCDGRVTLTAVQNAIATDWTTAVTVLGLPPIPASYRG